ncbi:WG repeat-containing protein [Amniculibacterium aquaticum]|uniref:WG repeat-containing protein n=1 Tax=Amniculibacterium aquaticum TaxID=2479858 RepID=UPI0013DE4BDC|nr:WG repeat-containing protein [Amniculibacterium aquaticum]
MKTVINRTFLILILFATINMLFGQNFKSKIDENIYLERKNNLYGIVDSLNKTIIPFNYDFIEYKNSVFIVRKGDKNGIVNIENREIIPLQFKYILPRDNNRFILWTKNSEFGLTDTSGKIILQVKYKSVSSNKNDDFYLTENKNGYCGVFDINGNMIFPEEYIFYTEDNYKIFATKNNKPLILDLLNPTNTIVLDENISFVNTARHFSVDEKYYQIIKQNNKYGLINSMNEIIIPVKFDNLISSQNWRYFIIEQNGKKGLINTDNKIIKEPKYDKIQLMKEYIILKTKDKKDEYYSYEY